jgi:hypothetical protein
VSSEWKCGGPPPEMRSPAAANGRASRRAEYWKPEEISDTLSEVQARSPLKLQAFCLARRLSISAPLAEALAPLVYGGLRT